MFLPLNQAPSGDDGLKHRPEPQRACSLLLRLADRAIYLLKASPVRAAGGGKGAQRRATVLLQTTARPAREGGQQLRAAGSSSLTASLASPCPGAPQQNMAFTARTRVPRGGGADAGDR